MLSITNEKPVSIRSNANTQNDYSVKWMVRHYWDSNNDLSPDYFLFLFFSFTIMNTTLLLIRFDIIDCRN